MDGDIAPVREVVEPVRSARRGIAEREGVMNVIEAALAKGFGSLGGYIAADAASAPRISTRSTARLAMATVASWGGAARFFSSAPQPATARTVAPAAFR